MKLKAKALILVVMFALSGASTTLLADRAGSSISYHAVSNMPEPGPLPDLIIKSATFYSSKAVVVVQNVGSAPSGQTNLALLLLWGTDPSSKVTNKFNKPVPPLSPGQISNVYFDIGGLTFVKHARRIMVDDTKSVTESNENNNAVFNSDFVAEQGAFPDPADSVRSNLTFSMVKFIAPNTVHFCVKNIEYPSSSFWVKISIFKGAAKDSGVTLSHSVEQEPLKSGGVMCADWTYDGADWNLGAGKPLPFPTTSILEGRGRLMEIIPEKGKDSDSTNKSHFSPGTEGLWQPKN